MKRQVYLAMKTIEEARDIFFSRFGPDMHTESESVDAENALGRVSLSGHGRRSGEGAGDIRHNGEEAEGPAIRRSGRVD